MITTRVTCFAWPAGSAYGYKAFGVSLLGPFCKGKFSAVWSGNCVIIEKRREYTTLRSQICNFNFHSVKDWIARAKPIASTINLVTNDWITATKITTSPINLIANHVPASTKITTSPIPCGGVSGRNKSYRSNYGCKNCRCFFHFISPKLNGLVSVIKRTGEPNRLLWKTWFFFKKSHRSIFCLLIKGLFARKIMGQWQSIWIKRFLEARTSILWITHPDNLSPHNLCPTRLHICRYPRVAHACHTETT